MTFSRDDNRQKLTVRVSDDLAEQLDDKDNKSAFVRAAIRAKLEEAPDYDTPKAPPEKEELAVAYRTIVMVADGRYCRPDAALPSIAGKIGMPTDAIERAIIPALVRRELITVVTDWTGRNARYRIEQ